MHLRWFLLLLLALGLSPSLPSPPPSDSSPLRPHERHSLEAAIAALEYRASRSGGELQAPNRAHGLRTYFAGDGVRVHDRTAPGSPLLVGLRASGVGRPGALAPIPAGELHHEASRVEIRRPGLVEWYENRPDGLEQGFTLDVRPAGEGELVLALALDGADAALDGKEVAFTARTSGRRLSYAKLVALDASGRTLPSRLELAGDREAELRLVVDDGSAAYPVVIDPLLTNVVDATLESNQANARLGTSVASAGDVNGDGFADVIAGAALYDVGSLEVGAAFVFYGGAAGVPDGGPGPGATELLSDSFLSAFGTSVASAGDVNGDGFADVIVGAPTYALGQGAAFVFHGGPGGIPDGGPASADTRLDSGQAASRFGESVASAGDVNGDGFADVIVGAPLHDLTTPDVGIACVFHGGATGIADATYLSANTRLYSNQGSARFGASVSGAGDVNGDGFSDVLVGAPLWDGGSDAEGGAFLFLGTSSGVIEANISLAAAQLEGNQIAAEMGFSVASAGDVNGDGLADVIVGARFYDAGEDGEGAAFVFAGRASGLMVSPALARIEANVAGASLGETVAGAGDVNGDGFGDVIVGAPTWSFFGASGGWFLFFGGPDFVAAQLAVDADASGISFVADTRLGTSVAGAGDVNGDGYADIVVGAREADFGHSNEGAAFVLHGAGQGIVDGNVASAASAIAGDQVDSFFGGAVASAGDVNADGFGDVIVGAPLYDSGQDGEGAAFVLLGGPLGIPSGAPSVAVGQLESDQIGAGMGWSVAAAGDVDDDGYGDVIVGAPSWENSLSEDLEGAAFVFRGGPLGIADGTPSTAYARLEANQAGASMGSSVAGLGDVNGDGLADVAVGARFYEAGTADEGAVFVFSAGPAGLANGTPTTASSRLESDQEDSGFGHALAAAGDVNGDGFADLIVGAPEYDAGQNDEGAAFLYRGGPSGITSGGPGVAAARLESDQELARLGDSVAGAGDVNGDGFADLIVGAESFTVSLAGEGAAFVFHGGPTSPVSGNTTGAATRLRTFQASARVTSVAGLGDVDADGFADVAIGSLHFGTVQEGAALVFHGRAGGIPNGAPNTAAAILQADESLAFMGGSVAGAGDVNGDGFADLVVGAVGFGPGNPSGGGAFVFHGNADTPAPALRMKQLGVRVPVFRAAQPWSWTGEFAGFLVERFLPSPEGRIAHKVELEACPPGTPFGDAACERFVSPADWAPQPAGFSGRVLQAETGPIAPALYRWRVRGLRAPLHVGAPGVTAPPHPAHGPWRRLNGQVFEGDLVVLPDPDFDWLIDRLDNCPTVFNGLQDDLDGDGVGDACDNCTTVANPRVAATFLAGAPWATLTGGQRDDDHDGYGNRCDAKFPGVAGALVNAGDLAQFRASNGKNRAQDVCGTSGTRPCAIFDLNEAAATIGAPDLSIFRAFNGKLPGPRCGFFCTGSSPQLPCEAGASGTCGPIP